MLINAHPWNRPDSLIRLSAMVSAEYKRPQQACVYAALTDELALHLQPVLHAVCQKARGGNLSSWCCQLEVCC